MNIRAALAAFNRNRTSYPIKTAVLDAVVVSIIGTIAYELFVVITNFTVQHWPIGTYEFTGYVTYTQSWQLLIPLGALFAVAAAASCIVNLSDIQPKRERRSKLATSLAIITALALYPMILILIAYLTGTSVAPGDIVLFVCSFGLAGVPAALTLTHPADPNTTSIVLRDGESAVFDGNEFHRDF